MNPCCGRAPGSIGGAPEGWCPLEAADRRWCVIHATHMEPREVEGLAATGAVAGLCPSTEASLGDGIFALRPWLAAMGFSAMTTTSPGFT